MVFQDILRNSDITIEAKGVYAYLAGFAGTSDECYPSITLMCEEMGISKTRLYKHMDVLIQYGVVEKIQTYNGNIKGKVIYKLTHSVNIDNFRVPRNGETENCNQIPSESVSEKLGIRENGNPQSEETKNNSLKNNSNKNNNINYQLIADMYNATCVSFPRLTKLSDRRKKAIKARLKNYSIEDFKKLFEMAEGSSFLKGQNTRNWSATFDWLIMDGNMAKVLDGNYADNGRNEVQQPQPKVNAYQEQMEKMLGENYKPTEGPFF